MRKLMFITIGFVLSLICCVYLLQLHQYIYLIPISFLVVLAVILLQKHFRFWKHALLIMLGCILGVISLLTFDSVKLKPLRAIDGQTITATIEICDYNRKIDSRNVVEGKIEIDGRPYSVIVYYDPDIDYKPGDSVSGDFRIRYTSIGGNKSSTYHQGDGIFLLAYTNDDFIYTVCQEVPAKYFAAEFRHNILSILKSAFPEDTQGFAKALLLGDSNELSFHIDNAFKVSGIRHIIAVSGLHVSILFSLVYLLAGKRRFLTAIIGIPVLVFFAAVAGFTPSVVRACIMQGLLIMALLLNREYDPPTALSFAVLVMLLINPMAITSVSLQLSAGCMVGIFAFSLRINKFLLDENRLGSVKGKNIKAKIIRWFTGSVSVSIGAMIPTMPLCAYYFGMVSIVGVITNLLTLWVVSFIFYGIMLVCVAYLIWPFAGKLIGIVVSVLIRYVIWIADILADIPFAAIYTCSVYTVFWIIFAYTMILLFFLFKRRKPFVFVVCIVIGLFTSVAATYLEPRFDNCRMTTLDVGQGQCILLQSKDKYYLVDCGGDGGKSAAISAINLLKSQGVSKLDAVILSHFDSDHAGGVSYLLSEINTQTLYVTTSDPKSDIDDHLWSQYGEIYTEVSEKTVLVDDTLSVTIFPGEDGKTGNENSLCVLFQADDCDILITGDRSITSENSLIDRYDIPKIDILVAGHHGSDGATGLKLLAATEPENVVISVGIDNAYGHPNEATLKRLKQFDCNIFRTDHQGTIVFRR